MSQTHAYQLSSKAMGRPQRRGWVTFEQVDGWTDFDSVRMVFADQKRRSGDEVAS